MTSYDDGRAVKFRLFFTFRRRKLCRISLVEVFFASDPEDIALLPGRSKTWAILLLFRALVFLIRPRNEYPVVGFIATRQGVEGMRGAEKE